MYRMKAENHNKGLFYHPSPRQLRGGSLIDDSGVNYGKDTSTKNLKASSDFAEQHKTALSDIDMQMPTLKSGSKKDRDLYRQQMAIYNKKVKDKEKGFHKQYKSEIMGNLDEQFLQAGYTKDKNGKWTKPASIADVPFLDKAIGWIPGATDFANRAISAGEKVYNKPNLENIINAGQTLADSAMSGYNMGKQLADPKKLIKDIAIQQGKKLVGMGLPKDYNKIDNHYNSWKMKGRGTGGAPKQRNKINVEEEPEKEPESKKKEDGDKLYELKGYWENEDNFIIEDAINLSYEDKMKILEKERETLEKSNDLNDALKLLTIEKEINKLEEEEEDDKLENIKIKNILDKTLEKSEAKKKVIAPDIAENKNIINFILNKTLAKSKDKKEALAKAKEEAKAIDSILNKTLVKSKAKKESVAKSKEEANAIAEAKAKTLQEIKPAYERKLMSEEDITSKKNIESNKDYYEPLMRLETNKWTNKDLEKVQKYISVDIAGTAGKGYEKMNATRINNNDSNKIIIYTDIKTDKDGAINNKFDNKYKYRFYGTGNPEKYFVDAIEIDADGNQILYEDKHYLHFDPTDKFSEAIIQDTKFESASGFDNLFYNIKTGKFEILNGVNKPINIIKIDKDSNKRKELIPVNNISKYYINIAGKDGVEYVADMLEVAKEVCDLVEIKGSDYKKFVVKDIYKLNSLIPDLKDYPKTREGRNKRNQDYAVIQAKYKYNFEKDPDGIINFIFPKKFLKLRYNKK